MWYFVWHENMHVLPTNRGSTPQGDRAPSPRQTVPVDCPNAECFLEFCRSLVSGISKGGSKGTENPLISRQASSPFKTAEGAFEKAVAKRCGDGWLFNRNLDFEANSQADSATLWGELYSDRCVVASGSRFGMELSEARTSRSSARRGLHCSLEEGGMAAYKKKPDNLAPIWFSSTKAGFCSSPTFVKPGPQKEKLPSCVTVRRGIEFRPLARSRSRPSVSDSACTWNTTPSTSLAWRSSHSFKTSCVIFRVISCFCGMVAQFTDVVKWLNLSRGMGDFVFIAFHPMRRSSIQSNLFGVKPRMHSQTARILRNQLSMPTFGNPSEEPVDRSNCFDPVSKPPICLGDNS